jgi:Recombinase zinc beta ribbon domain
MAVPPIIEVAEFEAVQALLKSRSPALTAPRIVSGPTLLTGICFCAACGMAMTLRTGKSGRYRYYTCSTKSRQGETGCKGRTVPMEKLDTLVADHIEQRLLQPNRLEKILSSVLDRRDERTKRQAVQIAELRKRATEADAKLKRLYDAIENGVTDLSDLTLKDRIAEGDPRLGSCRRRAGRGRDRSAGADHHTAIDQDVCQDGPQADAERERRLSPRLPSCACPTRRSQRERTSHHGLEERTAAHPRRRFKRKNGGFWRSQFCTEVARPTRFERVTFAFRVRWPTLRSSGSTASRPIRPSWTGRAPAPRSGAGDETWQDRSDTP